MTMPQVAPTGSFLPPLPSSPPQTWSRVTPPTSASVSSSACLRPHQAAHLLHRASGSLPPPAGGHRATAFPRSLPPVPSPRLPSLSEPRRGSVHNNRAAGPAIQNPKPPGVLPVVITMEICSDSRPPVGQTQTRAKQKGRSLQAPERRGEDRRHGAAAARRPRDALSALGRGAQTRRGPRHNGTP